MSDSAAWFVDGSFLFKEWQGLNRDDRLDYLLLRRYLERKFQVQIADAYYFNADPDPLGARNNAFHLMRSYGHRQWRTLLLAAGDGDFHEVVQHLVEHLDVAVILIGTTNSMSRELLPYAQAVEELDRIANEIARPAPNGANHSRYRE